MKWKAVVAVSLILGLMFAISNFSEAQMQVQYSLDLEGVTWNHSTLSVLIIPQENESWWKSSYLNATLRAIDEWNHAIMDFVSNYSDFEYLSRLRMVPTVTHALDSGFDVYISWTEESLNASADEIGDTRIAYGLPCTMINATVSLAAKTLQGYVLNEVDMQNVALHELGHSLGLGHSDYVDDIMYPVYTPREAVRELSTLDIYAVSMVSEWMSKYTQFNPTSSCPQTSSVTLPSSIPYQYLSISYGDLPPVPLSQTPLDYILQFILRPEFLIPLLIAVTTLIFLVAASKRRKEPQKIPMEDMLSPNVFVLQLSTYTHRIMYY